MVRAGPIFGPTTRKLPGGSTIYSDGSNVGLEEPTRLGQIFMPLRCRRFKCRWLVAVSSQRRTNNVARCSRKYSVALRGKFGLPRMRQSLAVRSFG